MDKFFRIYNLKGDICVTIGVKEEDFEVARARMAALQARWNRNVMELVNNGHPTYARDYTLHSQLEVYLKKDYLISGDSGREITYWVVDSCADEPDDVDAVFDLKYLKEWHVEDM